MSRLSATQNAKAKLALEYDELIAQFSDRSTKRVGNYVLDEIIGEGSFGKVYLASHAMIGSQVVLKAAPRSSMMVIREILHLRKLFHPNITALYEAVLTDDQIYLVLEYCSGRELFLHLWNSGRFSFKRTQKIFSQIAGAVAYLHSRDCVHRDIKLENILLDEKGNAKLCDFGFTRQVEARMLLETRCGTVSYLAPEMLKQGVKYNGKAVDIWALGVILYALVTGQLPFDENEEDETRRRILNNEPDYPDYIPPDVLSLIKQLLDKDPTKRPSGSAILNHPFISDQTELMKKFVRDPDPRPFETKLERDLLKKLKYSHIDTDALVESVMNRRCDTLYGYWTLSLNKEYKHKAKQKKKKRTIAIRYSGNLMRRSMSGSSRRSSDVKSPDSARASEILPLTATSSLNGTAAGSGTESNAKNQYKPAETTTDDARVSFNEQVHRGDYDREAAPSIAESSKRSKVLVALRKLLTRNRPYPEGSINSESSSEDKASKSSKGGAKNGDSDYNAPTMQKENTKSSISARTDKHKPMNGRKLSQNLTYDSDSDAPNGIDSHRVSQASLESSLDRVGLLRRGLSNGSVSSSKSSLFKEFCQSGGFDPRVSTSSDVSDTESSVYGTYTNERIGRCRDSEPCTAWRQATLARGSSKKSHASAQILRNKNWRVPSSNRSSSPLSARMRKAFAGTQKTFRRDIPTSNGDWVPVRRPAATQGAHAEMICEESEGEPSRNNSSIAIANMLKPVVDDTVLSAKSANDKGSLQVKHEFHVYSDEESVGNEEDEEDQEEELYNTKPTLTANSSSEYVKTTSG
ncbi:hypothetical protein CANCADRAFT_30849 [Tortispora caseinolytica NRRL Y-17796]|uniref:Protein kinase domain-containing protein n=1 Tax=Tortispora caseinolytica NRRL Y-17796 TaxID=767744 RepID=A0A1E4TM37_9ASCO|nr:hypothetical protein CANCADRAFT_30849 [Tortispora caseinolytica NRRL Y-17796]